MDGIGPALPLHRDDKFGSYSLIENYGKEIKQNFKNLLLTSPGERMMIPEFGVGLRTYLFQPLDQAAAGIRQRISNQVTRYMPFVRIIKIQLNHNIGEKTAIDSSILSISIEYSVPSLDLQSSLVLQAEDIN